MSQPDRSNILPLTAISAVVLGLEVFDPKVLPSYQAWSALAFCVSVVVAHATFARLISFIHLDSFASLGLAAVLYLPFFAAGTLVTLSLLVHCSVLA